MEHNSAEGHSKFQVFCTLGSRARAWGAKEKGTATFSKPWTRADATSETICEPNEARKRPC